MIAGAGLLAVGAVVWFLFLRTPAVTNYPSEGTDIIALGDSLVYGTGSTRGNDFISLLSEHIDQPILNLGVPGDTTGEVLSRVKVLDKYDPKVVILLAGGNDYLRQVGDDKVFANLSQIIKEIQGRGAMVLLVGIRGGLISDPYAPRFKELSRVYGTAYVPNALYGLIGNDEYMADSVHPNDAGYALLAGRIAPVLDNLLE